MDNCNETENQINKLQKHVQFYYVHDNYLFISFRESACSTWTLAQTEQARMHASGKLNIAWKRVDTISLLPFGETWTKWKRIEMGFNARMQDSIESYAIAEIALMSKYKRIDSFPFRLFAISSVNYCYRVRSNA